MIEMKNSVVIGLFLVACSGESFDAPLFTGAGGAAGESGAGTGGAAGEAIDAGAEAGGAAGQADAGPCTITVTKTVYANNCGNPVPLSSIASECNGKPSCAVAIDFSIDPGFDPAPGCAKDLRVDYFCGTTEETSYVPPEAHSLMISCC